MKKRRGIGGFENKSWKLERQEQLEGINYTLLGYLNLFNMTFINISSGRREVLIHFKAVVFYRVEEQV